MCLLCIPGLMDTISLLILTERETFRWVQKYISAFGGDPRKVTMYDFSLPALYVIYVVSDSHLRLTSWGESAGAISVAMHMLHNDGDTDGLFRAAFMQSGAPIPTGQVDNRVCQAAFDQIVAGAGCSGSEDTLACLRNVTVDVFNQSLAAWSSQSGYFVSLNHDMTLSVQGSNWNNDRRTRPGSQGPMGPF